MKPLILILLLLASSCTIQHRAARIHTVEATNRIERYMETVWNRENNLPGEHEQKKKELRLFIKQNRKP